MDTATKITEIYIPGTDATIYKVNHPMPYIDEEIGCVFGDFDYVAVCHGPIASGVFGANEQLHVFGWAELAYSEKARTDSQMLGIIGYQVEGDQ